MPIPSPLADETDKEFVQRCMSDSVMEKEFPQNKQRIAVCLSQLKQAKKQQISEANKLDWDEWAKNPWILL